MTQSVYFLPNGRYFEFADRVRDSIVPVLENNAMAGHLLVEALSDGRYLGVRRGSKNPKDLIVCLLDGDGKTELERLSYQTLLEAIADALNTDPNATHEFVDLMFQVFGGGEPAPEANLPGCARSGEYLLKAWKWILVQEDLNYPISNRHLGRKMAGYKIREVIDGVAIDVVLRKLTTPGRLFEQVDYDAVDRAL